MDHPKLGDKFSIVSKTGERGATFIRGHAHEFKRGLDNLMLAVDADAISNRIKEIVAQVDAGTLGAHQAKSILLTEITHKLDVRKREVQNASVLPSQNLPTTGGVIEIPV